MAILSSTRNLLIFGGLGVFALGWGGGHLLGAFNSKDTPPPSTQPQLVDADAYSPSKEEQESGPQQEKSSSLLEQVFGLDDLEEEKPAKRVPKHSRAVSGAETAPSEDPKSKNGDLADQILQGSEPAAERVELEDSPGASESARPEKDPTDGGVDPAEDATSTEAKPQKDILSENPYK